jgi:hypothetical protein
MRFNKKLEYLTDPKCQQINLDLPRTDYLIDFQLNAHGIVNSRE